LASDPISRRRFLASTGGLAGGLLVIGPAGVAAQEGVFMRVEDAPRALFPDAGGASERTVVATAELRAQIRTFMGRAPSLWEPAYRIFTLEGAASRPGFVVIVEEIGKHRPITFAVAIDADGRVKDLAVLAYREAYGGEVRERRFLKQYAGKSLADPLLPYRDIRNISGATLSVEATGRAARKAVAVLKATGDLA
jgi:Na+-transporting NADH:ubiquinone oxidoreductase subunit C